MDRSTDHKACTSLNSSMDLERMRSILGEGPSRFAPTAAERNIQEQLDSLSTEERECVEALIDKWDTKFPGDPLEDVMVLRCARNSHVPFHAHQAWTMMKKLRQPHNSRLLTRGATKMEKHLEGKMMFPLPGLKTRNNHDVLYMKSARFVPGETSSNIMIDKLAYCINSMYEKEFTCRDGIALMANMKDWTMRKHFSTRYSLKVSGALGRCQVQPAKASVRSQRFP